MSELRIIVLIGIPIAFIIARPFAKGLVRTTGMKLHDSYLGLEFTLAALSAELLFVIELKENSFKSNFSDYMTITVGFVVISILFLFIIMVIHKAFEEKGKKRWLEVLLCMFITNLLGGSLVVSFLIFSTGY